jgi:uncharacterized protein (TIGR02186 family)
MRAIALLLCAWLWMAGPVWAQLRGGVQAAGVTETEFGVSSDYRGAQLWVFGVSSNAKDDVIITLRGPTENRVIRRKRRMLGLWVNADPVSLRAAPSFFAMASTRPPAQTLRPSDFSAVIIDPSALARIVSATPADASPATYRRALVRLKREAGLYRESPRGVALEPDGAFKTPFIIPANAPIGEYRVTVYFVRSGRLMKTDVTDVAVRRVGVERTIHQFAMDRPLVYGLFTVAMALLSGWIASILFRRA